MPQLINLPHPAGHEKIAQVPGEPLVSDPFGHIGVGLTSKSMKSVPISEKTPDTKHNGFSYARTLTADDIASIKTAQGMDLRKRYVAEAHSHKNMKRRAKEHGKIVSPAISNFRDFLLFIGPMPQPGLTLDRIDNDDPEYAPGKVRWATKRVQNNNKSDTRIYTLSVNGRRGISRIREPLPIFVLLLSREVPRRQDGFQPTDKHDDIPPTTMIGEVPGWCIDWYTRPGRAAIKSFLRKSTPTSRWIEKHIAPRDRAEVLGGLVFRGEGGCLRRRLQWPAGSWLRRTMEAEAVGFGITDATEALDLVRNDLPLLNKERRRVL